MNPVINYGLWVIIICQFFFSRSNKSFYSLGTNICSKETSEGKHKHEQQNDTRVLWQVDGILHSGPGHALGSQINICPIPKCP